MQTPNQQLLHVTSRGSRVRKIGDGTIGKFSNLSMQAINDINKFGLLHYSIPKILDTVDADNRSFVLRVVYSDNVYIDIPVTLPEMDYYNMSVDTIDSDLVSFTEVLQTTINWAIQKHWTKHKGDYGEYSPLTHVGVRSHNRLGCIVRLTPLGRLQFLFGYRGAKQTGQSAYGYWVWGAGAVLANTGTPIPCIAENVIAGRDFPGVAASDGRYKWIDTNHEAQIVTDANSATVVGATQCQLKRVEFHGLSQRMQFMLGVEDPDVMSPLAWLQEHWVNTDTTANATGDALYVQRGRIILVNYEPSVAGGPGRLGILNFTMSIPPKLYAPSFMYLALTTQGTRSRVLGHDAERGGWAVPTAANQFKSKWDNFPGFDKGMEYDYEAYQIRQMPAILNYAPKDREIRSEFLMAVKQPGAAPTEDDRDGHMFDQLPYGADANVFVDANDNTANITELHNFSLSRNGAFENGGASETNHRFGSRMIHFGDLHHQKAMAEKRPRDDKQFGLEQMQESPTFTVSMIDPNWIFTDVPNSTIQSLDIQLLWGDTNTNVTDVVAQPVQFTLIASQ